MKIKYNNQALLHAYKKHGVTKNQIENSLASGIEKRIQLKRIDDVVREYVKEEITNYGSTNLPKGNAADNIRKKFK